MADEEDTESEDEVEYSGMIQPPLINQLKTILAEYPDDGQILKELIQNAEDAEAREMKILYDGRRCVQGEVTKKTPFRKYFQGPALIVYNNAAFTEEDWKGIKMLYSSIKEFDRSKVGRFGLGFKSVFHITDYPLVVSGKQLLVIDPHQDSSRVCQTMQLKKLNKYRKMKVEDCAAAFFGVFGFCQTTLDEGYFDGTMFRFPLRQVETKLSDNIYTENKVEDLFISFQDEASVTLLFLKCLEKISIFKQNIQTMGEAVGKFCFSVHIDSIETVRSVRNDFRKQIKQIKDGIPDSTICSGYNMKICIKQQDSGVVYRNWKVMNMFKGGQMSQNLQLLSKDQSLSYSPYVGIAMDMDNVASFIGHIFCFLPLPMTERSLTGLPLHINGFFALSQNRRVVKWPTADQIRHGAHTDKSIRWNTTLIEEVVSELYVKFIKECIDESNRLGNADDVIETVTRCIPHDEEIDEHWKILIQPLKARLKNVPLFFTKNGQKWLTVQEAVFVRQQWKEQTSSDVMKDVLDVLYLYRINIVEIEDHVWDFLGLNSASVQEVTPAFLHRIFIDCDKYSKCGLTQKLNFLRFLASDGNWNNFDCLQLLHLQSNTFVRFSKDRHCTQVYLCSQEQQEILPGMAGCLLNGHGLPHDLHEIYRKLAESEIFQVRPLQTNGTAIIQLLKLAIDKNCKGSQTGDYLTWKTNSIQVFNGWIDCLWNYINKYFPNSLDLLGDLNILPIHIEHGSTALLKPTDIIVLGQTLSKNVSACLKRLSINVVTDLPYSVKRHPKIFSFIHQCSVSDISDAIGRLHSANFRRHAVEFNQKCSKAEKEEFRLFMSKEKLKNTKSKQVISELDLFATNTGNNLVSVLKVRRYLSKDIPVKYPSQVLVSKDLQVQKLIKNLGGIAVEDHAMFTEILQCLVRRQVYTDQEMKTMMKYIVENKIYKMSKSILSLVRMVPFVPNINGILKPASQLFDPEDNLVSQIVQDQSLLPHHSVASSQNLKILRKLGLKSAHELTADDVLSTAVYLHNKSLKKQVSKEEHLKAKALLGILEFKPCLFGDCVQSGDRLRTRLMEMQIIIPLSKSEHYVQNLPWYRPENPLCTPKEVYKSNSEMLIGSVCPLISSNTSECLLTSFEWNKKPTVDLVLQQHNILRTNYSDTLKSEYMLPIKHLYQYFTNQYVFDRSPKLKQLGDIWMGDGFCSPKNVYMKEKRDDISLKPYMYKLPLDFQTYEMRNLMEFLGCIQHQCSQVLVDVLHMIKQRHETNVVSEKDVQHDLDLAIRILNKLKSDDDAHNFDVLFPVHNNTGHLDLRSAKDCNYCNAEWLKEIAEEDGETMLFVHANIPSDTADKLGVPSLTQSLLSDTEGIQEWGQSEPLTRRLKNLLTDYKDGFAVPKEIIQNADDAKAETVRFLYDERENNDCRTRLIDENMESCQGPALWAFNDAIFSKKDLENITKLSGATKAEDSSKVGKFGLGFCSVYNLTDVPSFITESTMVIFDPHAKYLGKAVKKSNPGIKIDLHATKNKLLLRRMKNQFKPFNHIFGCNLEADSPSFNGTLFRLPLRTRQQARDSEISNKDYDEKEIKSMIRLYIENAGNLLLFTQHVKVVEFYHLSRDGNIHKPTLLHRVSKEVHPGTAIDVLSEFSNDIERCKQDYWRRNPLEIHRLFLLTINTELSDRVQMLLGLRQKGSQSKWLISWASGINSSLQLAKIASVSGAVPLASVAAFLQSESGSFKCKTLKSTPFGFYKESHIFCYLPLPVSTHLPFHVNGSFAVSANRRQLSSKTSDDLKAFEHEWNQSLMEDAVTRAYINLLECLQDWKVSVDVHSELWPVPSKQQSTAVEESVCKAFYSSVIQQNNRVFCRESKWVPVTNCCFIEPELLSSHIGDIVLKASTKYLERNDNTIIKIQKEELRTFTRFHGKIPDALQSRIKTTEAFFEELFFSNIEDEFWTSDFRQKLLLYALDNPRKRIKEIMENTECIPTRPHGKLRKPKELVNIHGKVASLYSIEDERFIESAFERHDRIEILKSMGMMTNEISEDMLLQRIISINKLASSCINCGFERCKTVFHYMCGRKMPKEETLRKMRNVSFLPILSKPKDWQFSWFAAKDDRQYFKCKRHSTEQMLCRLARPVDLFAESCKNLVGCEQLILDETLFDYSSTTREIFCAFGVKYRVDIPPLIVVNQIINISQTVDPKRLSTSSKTVLQRVCDDIYNYLDSMCQTERVDLTLLKDIPCILVDDLFVHSQNVAIASPVSCVPALYSLDRLEVRKNTSFLQSIGVKKVFDVEDVTNALNKMKNEHSEKKALNSNAIDLACKLVSLLSKTITREKLSFEDDTLCIPDENGHFSAIKDLCMDDNARIQKGHHLRYPHENISQNDARTIGVQSKLYGSLQPFSRKFRPFGQKEELTSRIKRILSGYPCDEGVLKEMLQNADDAGATEVKFIADFNQYSTKTTFGESWKILQGPALLIYNNSYFTETDLEGIQHLGIGSKGDDPTKTGQYGVGFNAVYHLTDVPSFISKAPDDANIEDSLCAMDPHCLYVPGATKENPGIQFVGLDDLKVSFPDVFSCYHEDLLLSKTGTVFRLPLRSQCFAEKSELRATITKEKDVKQMLENFEAEMINCLLFLRNIRKISIASIENDQLVMQYTVEMNVTDEDEHKRKQFYNYVKSTAETFRNDPSNLPMKEVTYNANVKDSKAHQSQWCIKQRIGFEDNNTLSDSIHTAITQGYLGLLPCGGTAVPIDQTLYNAKAYCFLPLPIQTGLRMHVNGHFALDHEARRNLWTDDKDKLGFRTEWNKLLLTAIIAPVYASVIEIHLDVTGLSSKLCFEAKELQKSLKKFHFLFPDVTSTTDQNWALLANSVYKIIYEKNMRLFPSCHMIDNHNCEMILHSLQQGNSIFSNIVFNVNYKGSDVEKKKIVQIAKDLNMKVVETPVDIWKCLESNGIKTQILTPDLFISFLKSYRTNEIGRCILEANGCKLEETRLRKLDHLEMCIRFCKTSDRFEEEVDGLPLCLTENNLLQQFSTDIPIIKSNYWNLLPASSHEMLHNKLHPLLDDVNTDCIISLCIEKFVELLNFDLNYDLYRHQMVGWNRSQSAIPNKEWIEHVWRFLNEHTKDIQEQVKLNNILFPLLPWSIIPTTRISGTRLFGVISEWTYSLLPIQDAKYIINLTSFPAALERSLQKLNLPILDNECLPAAHPLRRLVASRERPEDVLECLYYHRNDIENNAFIDSVDCDNILEYFAGALDSLLKMENRQHYIDHLRSLPLFCTVHQQMITLLENHKLLVLSHHIPANGMIEWAQKTDTILLRQNVRLNNIFQLFDVTESTLCDVYRIHILPSFHDIPEEDRFEHLKFIKDELLKKTHKYDPEQTKLINAIKYLAFVPSSNNQMKKASEFFSPFNELMKKMRENPEAFPPPPFCNTEWKTFMTLAGMQTETTSELFIQFAIEVETIGQRGMTDDLCEKSNLLVYHLLYSEALHREGIYEKVSNIKFVVPNQMSTFYKSIHKYYQGFSNHLICYKGSVPSSSEALVWTNCPLIPCNLIPDSTDTRKKLGIKSPTIETVINHIKTVCEVLGSLNEQQLSKMDLDRISKLMEKFYDHLISHQIENPPEFSLLKGIPFIFIKDKYLFLSCDRIVTEMTSGQEIKPYAMCAPRQYGKFFSLFEKLGAMKEVSSKVYAKVLEHLFHETDNMLDPNELLVAKNAMRQVIELLPIDSSEVEHMLNVDKLYFLSTENQLIESTQLVFSNSPLTKHIIGDKVSVLFLSDIDGISYSDMYRKIRSLPVQHRPKFLTEIITNECSVDDRCVSQTQFSNHVTAYLTCDEFIIAVSRLVAKEFSFIRDKCFTENDDVRIKQRMKKISVRHAEHLSIIYRYRGDEIHREPRKIYYRHPVNDEVGFNVYCNEVNGESVAKWVSKNSTTLKGVIEDCVEFSLGFTSYHLCLMFHNIDKPSSFKKMLDKEDMPPSMKDKSKQDLPKPGSPVPVIWHELLDNSFVCFEKGDYVILLDAEGEHGNTCIYAIVEEKLERPSTGNTFVEASLQEYIIRVGFVRTEKRKAYDLYKVNRALKHMPNCIVLYNRNVDDQSNSSQSEQNVNLSQPDQSSISSERLRDTRPLHEIFKEIREELKALWNLNEVDRAKIYKRLLRKWHPDKNHGDEERTTEVFKYIKTCMTKLQAGKNIDENDDNEDVQNKDVPRPTPDTRFWFDDVFDDVEMGFRREREFRRRYHKSFPSGTNEHRHPRYEPDPQPGIAYQWMLQAKRDLKSSADSFASQSCDNNWICYLCHQAAEKALRSYQYEKDSKKVSMSEDLRVLVSSIPEISLSPGEQSLHRLARDIEMLTGGSRRMRYPERTHIPCNGYSRHEAETVLRISTQIVDIIDELVIS